MAAPGVYDFLKACWARFSILTSNTFKKAVAAGQHACEAWADQLNSAAPAYSPYTSPSQQTRGIFLIVSYSIGLLDFDAVIEMRVFFEALLVWKLRTLDRRTLTAYNASKDMLGDEPYQVRLMKICLIIAMRMLEIIHG